MEVTLYRADWEPFKDCRVILDYPVDAVLIEAAGCTLEVTQSPDGTQVEVLNGTVSAKGWFSF